MTVRSNDLAREICAALGIPVTMVRSIRIDMQAFEPARITIERLFQDNETNAITEVLERYTLQADDVRTQVGEEKSGTVGNRAVLQAVCQHGPHDQGNGS